MNKTFLPLLTLLFIIACSDNKNQEDKNQEEQTPEVLNNNRILVSSSDVKRYGKDIIQILFDEAVENNEELETLMDQLNDAKELKIDSLDAYQTYLKNNENYWDALNRYAYQLSDTLLRKEISTLADKLELQQSKRTASMDKLVAEIDSIDLVLKDMEIIMKIFVTQPMMNNYQRNKLPDIKTIESVKQVLDSSVLAVKPYTKIVK